MVWAPVDDGSISKKERIEVLIAAQSEIKRISPKVDTWKEAFDLARKGGEPVKLVEVEVEIDMAIKGLDAVGSKK